MNIQIHGFYNRADRIEAYYFNKDNLCLALGPVDIYLDHDSAQTLADQIKNAPRVK